MTDGLENASKEWHGAAIKALVELQTTQYHWEFLYMGADQDAVEVGAGLGIPAANSVTYARGKAREAMAMSAGKIRGLRAAGWPTRPLPCRRSPSRAPPTGRVTAATRTIRRWSQRRSVAHRYR